MVAADVTATATFVLAGITLALVGATIALVAFTRKGTRQARLDAEEQRKLLERQLGSSYRPLLVDVPEHGPMPKDQAQFTSEHPTTLVDLPGMTGSREIDPRWVFAWLHNARIFLSVPLRNEGRGLAVIDGGNIEIHGPGLGDLEYRAARRYNVPVSESTRIELVTQYRQSDDIPVGTVWTLTVPYADFVSEQYTVVELELVREGDNDMGPWRVRGVTQVPHDRPVAVAQGETRTMGPPREQQGQMSTLAGELADETPAPQTDARRRRLDVKHEPVTDVWGNPKRPRRRNR